MCQPKRVPKTNILPFPRARFEEGDLSQLRDSRGDDFRASVIEPSTGLALKRHGILDGSPSGWVPPYKGLYWPPARPRLSMPMLAMSVRDAAAKERPSPMPKNNQTGERHWRKMMMLGCAQTIA
jgi:hypothetical protein